MPVIDLFSKRQKRLQQKGQKDVYKYDAVPEQLRVQVIHIWKDAIGLPLEYYQEPHPISNATWEAVHDLLAREYGVFGLYRVWRENPATNFTLARRNCHRRSCHYNRPMPAQAIPPGRAN